jgi:nucleotide-binding universal stress UspA family protein
MAYKTILLSLNEINRIGEVTATAAYLASTFSAHITGLYVIPAIQIYPGAGYAAAPDIYDANRKFFLTNQDKVKTEFETVMKNNGLNYDFHVVEASTPLICNEVMAQGRRADVILVSATDRNSSEGVEYDFVERLVINSGRPVLIIPQKGHAKIDLTEVIVAWDGGREATRATFDALPLLQVSKRTRLVRIDASVKGTLPGVDIAKCLDRHGIKAEVTNVSSDGLSPGETLLRAANDFGAGVIVLGGYGHSRLTEFIFGGVTRYMVHHLDRPVLMSH